MTAPLTTPPEHNVTGIDYAERSHLTYAGPIIDIHTHVMTTRPGDPFPPPPGFGSLDQAASMLSIAPTFGVVHTVTMCPPDDITPLRERFGEALSFNGIISKQKADDPDDTAYQLLDRFLSLGVKIIKYWAAPRGRDRGLLVDTPWRIETTRRSLAAGIRVFMVHVGDPDTWFRTVYADASKFGTKPEQYVGLERMLQMFPEATWIGAHMGGDAEHPEHLEMLLEKYPHFCLDTSATKWQVREVSPQREAIGRLICKYPERFLFGTDLVTRHMLPPEHYVSRYWCQRTLWESEWKGPSPIADPDYKAEEGQPPLPTLHGVALPADVLRKVYHQNAVRLLQTKAVSSAKETS